MKRKCLWLMMSCMMQWVGCSFFHERSFNYIEDKNNPNELFGYTLAYQKHGNKLVFGAPNTATGEVYSCPKSSLLGDDFCKPKKEMDSALIESISATSRLPSTIQDYKFMLGASIAIVNDTIVTCAPMWSGTYKDRLVNYYKGIFVWGACFEVKDDKVKVLDGVYGHPRKELETRGSFGWRTLVDIENNLLLISKPASPNLHEDMAVIKINGSTLSPMTSLVFEEDPNFIQDTKRGNQNLLINYRNFGTAMASGKFWEKNKVIYAVSLTSQTLEGGVIFLTYDNEEITLLRRNEDSLQILIYSPDFTPPNAMFGAALCSAKLYGGSYTDLVVGAPAQHGEAISDPELGAIHIYKGSFSMSDFKERKLTIMGVNQDSRFGSSIVANDLDGDGIQELFVSAPYQEEGVVYILSGYEINLQTKDSVDVDALKYTQIIKKEGFKLLGFSLLALPDLDGNGCDEIAVGAPESNKVMILRCIPAITMNLTTEVMEYKDQTIPETVNNFTMNVCLNIDYKSKKERIAASVQLENKISGQRVNISCDPKLKTIDISKKEKQYCYKVTVSIEGNSPGKYEFSSKATLKTDASETDVFNPSWVRESPYSVKQKIQYIPRDCSGADCNYRFSMEFLWSGGEVKEGYKYNVDSKKVEEVLTLRVTNEGRIASTACAVVGVTGAPVGQLYCSHYSEGYLCRLPDGFRSGISRDIQIKLNMTELTNEFTGLNVTVNLYSNCDQKESSDSTQSQFYVEYEFTTDKIQIQNSSETSSITEKSMKSTSETIEVTHVYKISNKGRLLWKGVTADISMGDTKFVKGLVVSSEIMATHERKTDKPNARFTLDLNPLSKVKIVVTALVCKKRIEKLLVENKFEITSVLSLNLPPTSENLVSSATSTPAYEKDTTIAQNMTFIIIVGVIGAVLLLLALIYTFYRCGFFKRKQKVLLQEERRKSVRLSQNTTRTSQEGRPTSIEIQEDHVDDENAGLWSTDISDEPRPIRLSRKTSKRVSYQKMDETTSEKKSE